ncbi:MAG: hypothetical protein ACRDHY_02520, partial [Anaerolineales bacterium]
MRNKLAGGLAIFAGLLLLATGWVGGPGLLGQLLEYAAAWLGGEIGAGLRFGLGVLVFLGGLGGFTVLLGGFLIWKQRITTGRFLLWIGSGVSIFGLLMTLGIAALTNWPEALRFLTSLVQSAGWLGVLLSLVARSVATKP